MKKYSWVILSVILLLSACAGGDIGTYETVDIDEVQKRQDDGAIVLDVREVDEFAEGHIIDAVNLPLSELKQEIELDLNKEKKYVVICQSGNRSIEASNILFEAGYDLVNVSEGMSSWDGLIE